MPFARVANHQILQVNGDGGGIVVHSLALDVNFAATTQSQYVSPHQDLLLSFRTDYFL